MAFIKRLFREGDAILYLAFLWQFPLSWRWIVIDNRGFNKAQFNEYMDVSLYLGEVLLLGALIIYVLNNVNLKKSISINTKYRLSKWFHMEQIAPFFLLFYFGLNAAQSIDPVLSLTFIFHALLAIVSVILTKALIVSRGTKFLVDIAVVLFVGLFLQLLISGYQVIIKQSLGLYWLNESLISLEALNVAKAEIFDHKLLRGYGTFPHPNVLAAYALFIHVLFLIYRKLFHVKQLWIFFITSTVIILIIVTGSKTAFFLISVLYLLQKLKYLFHVKQALLLAAVFVAFGLISVYSADIKKSAITRIDQFSYQSELSHSTLIGSGIGTYRYSYDLEKNSNNWWILEPVHNSLYIAYKEIGLIVIPGLLFCLIQVIRFVSRGTNIEISSLTVFLAFYANTDHFLWDIQQGMYILITGLFIIYYNIDIHNKILYNNHSDKLYLRDSLVLH